MLNDSCSTLSDFENIPKRLRPVVRSYIDYLRLETKRHSFKEAAEISGLHESRYCSLLNVPETHKMSLNVVNRAARRRLKKLQPVDGRYVFIVDATIKSRRGKKVENVRKHHSGSGFVIGHKFVNLVVLTPEGVIPLASVPTHTQEYCAEYDIAYRTENEIVLTLLQALAEDGIFSPEQLRQAVFLLDSGYDAKEVQRGILELGAHFVVALKSNRSVQGKQVSQYFWSNRRWLPGKSIRLLVGNGGKQSQRKYSIRTATGVNLKGVGPITAVCSKAQSRARRPIKYLAASDPSMTGRQIVAWYAKRWKIELWHKEMKQHYGFGDCHSGRFTAVASHVNFCLAAFLLQTESGKEQIPIQERVRLDELRNIRVELTRFGAVSRLKTRIDTALQGAAA